MKKITTATFILCLSAQSLTSAAFAQQPQYKGGMKYTTMSAAQDDDTEKKTLYNRKPLASEESGAPKDALPKADATQAKPQEETIWDKYKELAQGKKENAKADSAPQKPEKPKAPSKQAKAEDAPKASGFSSIIENYQRNKEKRSQMKSISFTKPEVAKPEVKKPKVDGPKVDAPTPDKERSEYN